MDCSRLGSSVHRILQATILELPCPSPGNLLDPGIEPTSLMCPAMSGGLFTTSTTWEAFLINQSGMFKQLSGREAGGLWYANTVGHHTGTVHYNYAQQWGWSLHELCWEKQDTEEYTLRDSPSPQHKAGGLVLAVSRQCRAPLGEGGPWDPGVLAWAALLPVAGGMQLSFLGAVLHSSSTLYFNKMFQSDIKKCGNI